MDTTTTSKRLINIISNVVVLPLENTQNTSKTIVQSCTSAMTKTHDVETGASEKENLPKDKEESTMFKNLFFDLPNLKRKNDSEAEQPQKKSKAQEEEDSKIFNYLTGTYDVVQEEFQEEFKEEPILIEDHELSQDEPTEDVEMKENNLSNPNWVVVVKGLSEHQKDALSNIIPNDSILEGTKIINNNSVLTCNIYPDDEKVKANNSVLEFLLKKKSPSDCLEFLKEDSDQYSNHKSIIKNVDALKPNNHPVLSQLLSNDILTVSSSAVITNVSTLNVSSSLNVNGTLKYKCHSCSHTAKSKFDLITHIYNEHLKQDYVIKLKCNHCAFETESKSVLKQHKRSHNVNLRKRWENSDYSEDDPDYTAETSEYSSDCSYDSDETIKSEQYVCQKCGFRTKYSRYYNRHSNNCNGQGNWKQTNAEKCIQRKNLANIPIINCNVMGVKCSDCNYFFSTNEDLKRHTFIVHSGKTFRCDIHPSNDQVSKCSKCDYAIELKTVQSQGKQAKNNSQEVICLSDIDENSSENNIKNSILCDRNNSENSLRELNQLSSGIKCFDCNIFFRTNEELRRHAVLMHPTSSFKCNLHTCNNQVCVCNKCNYAMILRVMQNLSQQVKNNSLEVICFSDTNENPLSGQSNSENTCKTIKPLSSKTSKIPIKCFNCNIFFPTNEELRRHASIIHPTIMFNCNLHLSNDQVDECSQCNYATILRIMRNLNKQVKSNSLQVICLDDTNAKNSSGSISGKTKQVLPKTSKILMRCFDCNLIFLTNEGLRRHATIVHSRSNFNCKSHPANDQVYMCSNCNYANILRTIQSQIKNNSQEVICLSDTEDSCENEIAKNSTLHDTNNSELSDKPESCKTVPDTNKSPLKNMNGKVADNSSQTILTIIDDEDSDIIEKETASSINPLKHNNCSSKLQCFDCSYSITDNPTQFSIHVMKHLDSKFYCTDHLGSTEGNCPKCYYETILTGHKNYLNYNSEAQAELQCFCCEFKTDKKRLLKYHCMQHYDKNFKCDDHHVLTVDCQKCIFENVLKYTKHNLFVCDHCNFKTFLYFCFELHKNECNAIAVPSESNLAYKCFDCNLSCKTSNALEEHAMAAHPHSKFTCTDHSNFFENCPKCIYTKVIKELSYNETCANARITNKVNIIISCFDCKIQDENRPVFTNILDLTWHVLVHHQTSSFICERHVAKQDPSCSECFYQNVVKGVVEENYIQSACWLCEGKLFPHVIALKNHIKLFHLKASFKCPEHTEKTKDCSKCNYEQILSTWHKIPRLSFKCFDCQYTCPQLVMFTGHIKVSHPNSTFKCEKHQQNLDSCEQCGYSILASNKPNRFIQCYKCTASAEFSLEKLRQHIVFYHKKCFFTCPQHINGGGINCSMCLFQHYVQQIAYNTHYCLECSYNTPHLSNLRKHISKAHQFSKSKCDKHTAGAYDYNCPLCIYAKSKDVRNLRCFICPNKGPSFFEIVDLKAHIFKNHKKCIFVCPKHNSASDSCEQCYFQKLVKTVLEFACYDCNITPLGNKEALVNHIKEMHVKSNFYCSLHPLIPEVASCGQCDYEALVQSISTNDDFSRKATEDSSNTILTTYKCFDCGYTGHTVALMKDHIRQMHLDSTFMCTKHNLGEIDSMCQECSYESLVLSKD